MDIRLRAMIRGGQLIKEGQENGTIAVPGQRKSQMSPSTTFKTLEDFGITRDQSSQWKQLAGIPEDECFAS